MFGGKLPKERVEKQCGRREVESVGEGVGVENRDRDALSLVCFDVCAHRVELLAELRAELLADVRGEASNVLVARKQQVRDEFALVLVGLVVGFEGDGLAQFAGGITVVARLASKRCIPFGGFLPVADCR